MTSAGKGLNRLLPKHRWDKIRRGVYAEYGYRCAICGVDSKHAPAEVHPRHAPELTDSELVERYAKMQVKPLKLRPKKVRLECHEMWEYDETTNEQRLSSLAALCTRCHQVKHWNWAATQLWPPKWSLERRARRTRNPVPSNVERHLRKGEPWSLWGDEQKFAFYQLLNSAYYPQYYSLEYHFMWVNDCDLKVLIKHIEDAAEVCFRRSQHEWRIDYGEFA